MTKDEAKDKPYAFEAAMYSNDRVKIDPVTGNVSIGTPQRILEGLMAEKVENMTEWTKEEDEAFNEVEKHSNLGKQILRELGQPYHFDIFVSPSQRNQVLEEVALEIDKMKAFGSTAESFSAFVRGMKKNA
jgi:hypothetical protein